MKRGSSIVVGTDLSEAADEALRRADRWAREFDRELVVCHFVPDLLRNSPLFPQLGQQDVERTVEIERRAGDAVVARVTAVTGRAPGEFRIVVSAGPADAGLLDEAEEVGATLIVVGSRGASGLQRLVLGSVAERVAQYAHCPVLVARAAVPGGKVLVASDFSDLARPALLAAADVARRTGAELVALHSLDVFPSPLLGAGAPFGASWVTLPPETVADMHSVASTTLAQELESVGMKGKVTVTDGPAAPAIVRAAEELPADVVVVGTKGRTGIRRLVLGSVATSVIRLAPCSVLVVRMGDEASASAAS